MAQLKQIRIDPVTRIEGHGRVVITLNQSGQVDDRSVRHRHAQRVAVQLALELGDHHADGAGGARGGGDDRYRRRAPPAKR